MLCIDGEGVDAFNVDRDQAAIARVHCLTPPVHPVNDLNFKSWTPVGQNKESLPAWFNIDV